jgi:hypothetical protein
LGGTLANLCCCRIARIAQIVTIRRSCPVWLLNSFYSAGKTSRFRPGKCEKNHIWRKLIFVSSLRSGRLTRL